MYQVYGKEEFYQCYDNDKLVSENSLIQETSG